MDHRAVLEFRNQLHRVLGAGQHPASRAQERPREGDGFDEIVAEPGGRREKEIAEGVTCQIDLPVEAIGEDGGQRPRRVAQGQKAVADVSGREDAELTPQLARAAAVVRHGDDRREVNLGPVIVGRTRIGAKPAQDDRKPRTAPERNDPEYGGLVRRGHLGAPGQKLPADKPSLRVHLLLVAQQPYLFPAPGVPVLVGDFHRHTRHSTVTLLARFRGWSTSRPRRAAMWYARSWRGITLTRGARRSAAGGIGIRWSALRAISWSP